MKFAIVRLTRPQVSWIPARLRSREAELGHGDLSRMIRGLGRRLWLVAKVASVSLAVLLVCGVVFSVAMTLVMHGPVDGSARVAKDLRRLALASEAPTPAQTLDRFQRLYGEQLGAEPGPAAIRRYFERRLDPGEPLVLDAVMADYIVGRFGQIDGRFLPPGLYVGARALGPDQPPLARFTKYLGHYWLFARHAYVLVVPPSSNGSFPAARVISASTEHELVHDQQPSLELYAQEFSYGPQAYDFPRNGQSVHDLFPITLDHHEVLRALGGMRRSAVRIRARNLPYLAVRQNSNTVVGCLLRSSGVPSARFDQLRHRFVLRARLPAIGFELWPDQQRKDRPQYECSPESASNRV